MIRLLMLMFVKQKVMDTIKIIKASDDNDECWYNECVGQSFKVKEKPNFTGVHKDSVIVITPTKHEGWVWSGDYRFVND